MPFDFTRLRETAAEFLDALAGIVADDDAVTTPAPVAATPVSTQGTTGYGRNSTQVQLTLNVSHTGTAADEQRRFEDWARRNGNRANAEALVDYLLTKPRSEIQATAWSAPEYGVRG